MNDTLRTLINLTCKALGRPCEDTFDNVSNWGEITELAQSSKVLPLFYPVFKEIAKSNPEVAGIFTSLTPYLVSQALEESRKMFYIRKISEAAAQGSVDYRIFKGPVLADLYPEYKLRVSSDTDIIADGDNYAKMERLLESLGYTHHPEFDEPNVFDYISQDGLHVVELHSVLWGSHSGQRMDLLKDMDLTTPCAEGSFCGVTFKTMGFNEHLILLIFHFAKHLTMSEANIRFLLDIALYVERYKEKLDFDYLYKNLTTLNYWNFFCTILTIGHTYFGFDELNLRDMPKASASDMESTLEVLFKLVKDEIDEDFDLYSFTYNLEPYLNGEYDKDTGSKFARKMRYLFPKRENFPEGYEYVQKSPLLLPIAWIHRIVNYLKDRKADNPERMDATRRMDRVEQKIDILKKAKLL